jgi:CRP-like cAMP-binding protein
MNTIETLTVPVKRKPLYGERTHYIHDKLRTAWPPRKPKSVVESTNLFLRSLPSACMEKLQHAVRNVTLEREQHLWGQDVKPEHVYFPETAVISHMKMLEDGRTVEVALTGREGAAGMASLFGSGLSPTSGQVAHAGLALRIEREALQKIRRIYPELVPFLVAEIGPYISYVSQRSVCNTYHDVKQRFATWLLMIQDRCRTEILNVTHEQIARSLGIYRPSLTSIAVELRKNGSIQYCRGEVVILDRPFLESQACTCYQSVSMAY